MKFTITADAFALTSKIKVKDIELLKKCKKTDALKIKDEKGNEKFAISYVEGKPCIADFGITFSGKTRDENGYATLTGTIPSSVNTQEGAKEFVAETFGAIVAYLKSLEETVPAEAEKIANERKAIADSISVV